MYTVVLCSVWFSASPGAATLEPGARQASPASKVVFVEDPAAEWDFEQARIELEQQGRRWGRAAVPVFGFTDSAYWTRVDIDNRLENDGVWLARIRFPSLDRVDMYYQDGQGQWQQKSAGDSLPFGRRDVDHYSPNFIFPLSAGESTSLYFRIQSSGSLQFPLTLHNLQADQPGLGGELLLWGIFFGVLLIMAAYSLFMWYSSRDRTSLWFCLFILSGGLYSLSFHGLGFQYLWSGSPDWANYSVVLFACLSCVAGLLFVREFLDTREMGENVDRGLMYMLGLALTVTYISAFLPLPLAHRLSTLLALFAGLGLSVIAVLALRKGQRSAWFFTSAWAVLMLGVLLEVSQRVGMDLPPLLAYHSIQGGTMVSALILSLGLSDRVSRLMERYDNAQQQMIEANQMKLEALQRADTVKEEFIANVSHELRTPLTGIIGLVEIMLEDDSRPLNDSDRETLQIMKVSAQRLATPVNDVIDFASLKKGHLDLDKKDVELQKVCSMVALMTRPLLGDKPVELVEDYPDERVIVEADEDRLQQVLFNLVSNAIKFTRQGSVCIKLEVVDIDARVLIQDTGIGISDEEQKKIFNRFYQVDSTDVRNSGGTGLGLPITQKLLELHDSEIILRSRLGEGSTFYFDLPLKQSVPGETQPARTEHGPVEPERMAHALQNAPSERRRQSEILNQQVHGISGPSGRPGRILVVDDEHLNLRIVESHLSGEYELRTASSGADALERLEEEKPDLIILDLMMPVMSGFQLCQVVRKRYDMDELPIVILTAKNQVEDLVRGLGAGANDYITKPFSREELQVRVRKQFELLQLQQFKLENQRLYWQLKRYQDSERHLREREKRLARMLDITGDAMMCVDEGGHLVYINQPACRLFDVVPEQYQGTSLNSLWEALPGSMQSLSGELRFPFDETRISAPGDTRYFEMPMPSDGCRGRYCLLSISLEQEFYLLVFETRSADTPERPLDQTSLPHLIEEINHNVERTQLLGEYLARIKPEDLQKHQHLFTDLKQVDRVIKNLSGTLPHAEEDLRYRSALVKLMQDCHYYWQKVTGQSIVELAEQSRVWSVSVDNGRLRTRSMNRYLSVDKLPDNPRWRQVARTAYFVLSKVSHDEEARQALEASIARLQEIVEQRALG